MDVATHSRTAQPGSNPRGSAAWIHRQAERPKLAEVDSARLYFDDFPTPIAAKVTQRDAQGLTLRQELPFLKLDGGLRDEIGRRATLASVSVSVRDGVPSLVLEVRFDPDRSDDPTLDVVARLFPSDERKRRDETVPYRLGNPDVSVEVQVQGVCAPATPITPLSVPVIKRPWYRNFWMRLRSYLASV